MATSEISRPRRPQSIKAILVGVSVALGVITILAFLAGFGELTAVYGFVGVALLVQAAFYALL